MAFVLLTLFNYFLDEPSKPKTPEIIDYDNQSVTLKWSPPEKDGGAPIEKYFIEKKDKYENYIITIIECSITFNVLKYCFVK